MDQANSFREWEKDSLVQSSSPFIPISALWRVNEQLEDSPQTESDESDDCLENIQCKRNENLKNLSQNGKFVGCMSFLKKDNKRKEPDSPFSSPSLKMKNKVYLPKSNPKTASSNLFEVESSISIPESFYRTKNRFSPIIKSCSKKNFQKEVQEFDLDDF